MTVTETTTSSAAAEADKVLKTKHAAMWASGDYSRVADELARQVKRHRDKRRRRRAAEVEPRPAAP